MKRIYLMLLAALTLAACKKNDNAAPITPEEVKTGLTVTIDGQKTTVGESAMKAVFFADDTNPVKSLEVATALDAAGTKKLVLLLQDLKDGKITLAPKTATSANNQTFISYKNGDKTQFAVSGTVTVVVDAVKKTAKVSWDATFNDGTRDYKISGEYTLMNYDATKKPVADLKKAFPIALHDAFVAEIDTKLSGNVGLNDVDPNGGTLTYKNLTNPNNGKLFFNANGSFEYTPNTGYNGQDAFQYEVTNEAGLTAQGNAAITVKAKSPPGTPAKMVLKRNGVAITALHSGKLTYISNTFNNGTLWSLSYTMAWSGGAEFFSGGFGNALLVGSQVQLADDKVFDFNDPALKQNPYPWSMNNFVFSGLKYQTIDQPNNNHVKIVKFDKANKFISITGKLQYGGVTYEFEMEGTYADQ